MISDAAFHARREKRAGLMQSRLRRLPPLKEENAKLKRLIADLSLDQAMIQDDVSLQKSNMA